MAGSEQGSLVKSKILIKGKKNLRSGDGPNGGKCGGLCNNGLLSGSKGFGPGGLAIAESIWFLSRCSAATAESVAALLCRKAIGGAPDAGRF